MTKTLFLGAAAALLMGASAFAQDTGATPPGPTSPAPTNNNPATGVETAPATDPAMSGASSPAAGPSGGAYADPYAAPAPPPAPAGSAAQYGSDTATQYPAGAPYNPTPAPSQTEMMRAGERG